MFAMVQKDEVKLFVKRIIYHKPLSLSKLSLCINATWEVDNWLSILLRVERFNSGNRFTTRELKVFVDLKER